MMPLIMGMNIMNNEDCVCIYSGLGKKSASVIGYVFFFQVLLGRIVKSIFGHSECAPCRHVTNSEAALQPGIKVQ